MKDFCISIENRIVYPILIKNKNISYLTLYYYTEHSDSILHEDAKLLYFQSKEKMEYFCIINDLKIGNEVVEYNFDTLITNPIDYKRILENWNLLNTIASTFGMFFEGDLKKYTPLYDLLFRLNTPAEPISPAWKVSEKYFEYISPIIDSLVK